MLQDIGFDDTVNKISDPDQRFSPLEFAYTLVWMSVIDVDAPYHLNQMDLSGLATFLSLSKSPLKDDIYDFYKTLTEEECGAFVDELAKCYQKAGLIEGLVVFFDNHTIPYYGGVPIGIVYHTTRNMPIPGIHLAQLNDVNGNFILFKLIPSTIEFADILIEILERMKRVLDIKIPLILVVDREAEGLPLFQKLDERDIHFIVVITKNSKATEEMASISKSDFKEDFRENEKIVETKITLRGIPFRAGVILNENGNRYGFRTNIPKEEILDIKEIAGLIPARWRQENKFEEIKNGENGDKIASYEFIDAPNIHLQKRYEELNDKYCKVEGKIVRLDEDLKYLEKRYEKKMKIFNDRLSSIDKELENLEGNIRNAGKRKVFLGRLQKKIGQRDAYAQKYSTALSDIENKIKLESEKLTKAQAKKTKVKEELENIDFEAKFLQLNFASTTFSIAVKEAIINANQKLTRHVTHDGRPMKIKHAKKILYNLPGRILVDSSKRVVELVSIRNKPLQDRIEVLCDWMTEKQPIDTDGRKLVFRVKSI